MHALPRTHPRALRLRGPFKGADLRPRGGDDAEGPQPGRKRKWLSAGAAAAAEREAASWAGAGKRTRTSARSTGFPTKVQRRRPVPPLLTLHLVRRSGSASGRD
ncbi:Apoptotic chromatin condensation inducer in the nucleus [Manis javanica]|nr:Apoptotic chromatin condensation inducer in the nucleus [Manis javanica]